MDYWDRQVIDQIDDDRAVHRDSDILIDSIWIVAGKVDDIIIARWMYRCHCCDCSFHLQAQNKGEISSQ